MKASDYWMISKNTLHAYNKMCAPVLAKYDLPQVSFDILMFLANHPEFKTAQDISERKGIKKNLVSVHVEKLVGAGLLERGFIAGDRRKVSLSLTEIAKPIVEEGFAAQHDFYKRIISGISAEDWAAYRRINEQVMKNTQAILNG